MSHRTDRRQRKKRRERIETPTFSLRGSTEDRDSKPRQMELFRDPTETAADLRLVRRAVNHDWDVELKSRDWIIEQVMGIVRQESGDSEVESDQNSILACQTMFDMYVSAFRERQRTRQGS